MAAEGYPAEISYALVGSCTNSSYEDIGRAAHVARQAKAAGLHGEDAAADHARARSRCGRRSSATACSPTSRRSARPCSPTRAARASASGSATTSRRASATRSSRRSTATSRPATTATRTTLSFIGSPETVVGDGAHRPPRRRLRARPVPGDDGTWCSSSRRSPTSSRPRASTRASRGSRRRPTDPSTRRGRRGAGLRAARAARAVPGVGRQRPHRPAGAAEGGRASAPPTTSRPPVRGCSYRGHLTNISGNLFIGREQRVRARRSRDTGVDVRDGSVEAAARAGQARTRRPASQWVAVGDENYGEGSSREHAAMEPRYMGGRAVHRPVVRPHPRGEPEEAGRAARSRSRTRRLRAGARRRHRRHRRARRARARPSGHRSCCTTPTARRDEIDTTHTMSEEHIEWFQAGSALNVLRRGR